VASPDPYLEAWRSRARAADAHAETWRSERLAEARAAARALVEQLHARRVLLFGSLARGSARPGSDVDLWVEGLLADDYLDAVSLVRQHITATEVDLVRAEWSQTGVRERALREGILIHGE
jgi:uncharacterized protein